MTETLQSSYRKLPDAELENELERCRVRLLHSKDPDYKTRINMIESEIEKRKVANHD